MNSIGAMTSKGGVAHINIPANYIARYRGDPNRRVVSRYEDILKMNDYARFQVRQTFKEETCDVRVRKGSVWTNQRNGYLLAFNLSKMIDRMILVEYE